jgi:hypothetical protein
MLGHGRLQRAQAAVASRVLRGLAPLFRIALNDGIAQRACRRVGIAPQRLAQWPE